MEDAVSRQGAIERNEGWLHDAGGLIEDSLALDRLLGYHATHGILPAAYAAGASGDREGLARILKGLLSATCQAADEPEVEDYAARIREFLEDEERKSL